MTPTPEQLALARRITADGYYPLRHPDDYIYARDRILCGDMDGTVQVQTTLAAIIETSELAAKMAHNQRCYSVAEIVDALRNNEHLKGDGR